MTNRLVRQGVEAGYHARAEKRSYLFRRDVQAALIQHERGWLALLDDLGALNGVRRSGEFTLDALARGMCSGGSWGEPHGFPGCDHVTYFRRDRRAALVVTEPYERSDLERLRAYAAEHGLVVHSPPNPRASFWYPPHTLLVAITSKAFGDVKWLPDQLAYADRGI